MKTLNIIFIAVLISTVGLNAISREAFSSQKVTVPREMIELDLSCSVTGIEINSDIINMLELEGEKYDMAKMYTINYNQARIKYLNEIDYLETMINSISSSVENPMKSHYENRLYRVNLMLQDNWKMYNLKMAKILSPEMIERWNSIVNSYCAL